MVDSQAVYFDSKDSIFKLNNGSTLQDMSPYVREVRGLPGQVKMNDITTFGSTGERPGPSIFIAHFSVEFLFNLITTLGSHTMLSTMFANKDLRAFEWYPAGTSNSAKISGSAYLAIYEITSRMGDEIATHAEFHCDNAPTVA